MNILKHKTCVAFGSKTAVLAALVAGLGAAVIDEVGMQLAVLDITDVLMAVAPVEVTAGAAELLAIQDDIVVAANELIAIFSFLEEVAL